MPRLLKILILFLVLSVKSFSQPAYRFSHLTTSDGLPGNMVNHIVQSSDGFIWFGTNNGLARYDGFRFRIFQPDPDDSGSIQHKFVQNIIEDNQGHLWISFQNFTIDCFSPFTNKAVHYSGKVTSEETNTRNSTNKLFKDCRGNIWICSDQGLKIFQISGNKVKEKEITEGLQGLNSNKIYDLAEDKNANIWVATEKGINIIQGKPSNVIAFNKFSGTKSLLDSVAISCLISFNNDIYIGTYSHGLWVFNLIKKTLYAIGDKSDVKIKSVRHAYKAKNDDLYFFSRLPDNALFKLSRKHEKVLKSRKYPLNRNYEIDFYELTEDCKGNIWFTTSVGLYEYRGANDKLVCYNSDPLIKNGISGNETDALLADNNGVLWVGIYKVGVDKVDIYQKQFYWLQRESQKQIAHDNILGLMEDSRKNVWLGTYADGVQKINLKTGESFTFQVNPKSPRSLSANASNCFCEDNDGNIWVGSYSGQIDVVYANGKTIEHLNKFSNPSFEASVIRKIEKDKAGNIWICSLSHGLIEYNYKKKKFNYHSIKADKNFDQNGLYRTLYFDKKGRIWIGTQAGGAVVYDVKNEVFKSLKNDKTNKNSLANNTVYSFFEDSKDNMWIGTSLGLDKYTESTNTFKHYNTHNGLPSNSIYSLLPDNKGNLWISSDNGLSCYSIATDSIKTYFEIDGIISNEFNSGANYLSKSGWMYFGTQKGAMYFNPDSILNNPYQAKPIITGLQINSIPVYPNDLIHNLKVLSKEIFATSKMQLLEENNSIVLEFSSLHFANPQNTRFSYTLENFDKGWYLLPKGQNWVGYSNLSAGKYVFHLNACNNDGIWNNSKDSLSLTIEILPPFWKSWWIKLIFFLFVIFIGWLFLKGRLIRIRKRQAKLEALVAKRTRQLEESKESLQESQQETIKQKETLEEVNRILREQQERILKQNIELDSHRHHLEHLVEKRTSELKEAKLKAEESNRLKTAFLANMSHEIRTPMNAIIGFSNLISDTFFDADQKNEFIRQIKKHSESLLSIIDDILDLSKIQSHQLQIIKKKVELNPLFNDILDINQQIATDKGIQLRINYNNSPELFIYSDPVRLKQIFVNLINNAIKFTTEGFVEFGIEKIEDSFITFYVRDSGQGIPSEWHDAVFDRFTKLQRTEKELFKGAGLGLAISKSLVNLMGGKIWFESELNVGTIFYFTIPYVMSDESVELVEKEIKESVLVKLPFKGRRILVAEDEEANIRILEAYLKLNGAEVILARNGLEVLEIIKADKTIDLILMDLNMPVMDGVTATKLIKELDRNIPIVAQTAFASDEEKLVIEKSGFDNYIVKPINRNYLIDIVSTVLHK